MAGTRINDTIKWEAVPKVIKEITDTRFLFYRGGGGSVGLIGKMYFTSKEECENAWLKNRALEEHIDYEEKTPESIDELPRTNWETYELCKFDTVDLTTVYIGGLSRLRNVTPALKWRVDESAEEYLDMKLELLTLKEISDQLGDEKIITVIHEGPMHTEIFQHGNYLDAGWVRLGEVMGYA